jgi:hypothetical protein
MKSTCSAQNSEFEKNLWKNGGGDDNKEECSYKRFDVKISIGSRWVLGLKWEWHKMTFLIIKFISNLYLNND